MNLKSAMLSAKYPRAATIANPETASPITSLARGLAWFAVLIPVSRRIPLCLLVGLVTALSPSAVSAAKTDLESLFAAPMKVPLDLVRPADAQATRSRLVQLNPRLLTPGRGTLRQPGARMIANLFDDQEHVIVADRVDVRGPGEFTCFGHVEQVPGSQVILASVDGATVGTITLPFQEPFQIEYLGEGLHRINQMSLPQNDWCAVGNLPSEAPNVAEPKVTAPERRDYELLQTDTASLQATTSAPVVDFLVVYTPRVLAGAGGEAGINALIDFVVAENNACYANSGINARWNIMARSLVNYTESGSIVTDLGWLASDPTVVSLKNSSKSDLVMLIVEFDRYGYGGVASGQNTVFLRPLIN
jgi:hypothetical protein